MKLLYEFLHFLCWASAGAAVFASPDFVSWEMLAAFALCMIGLWFRDLWLQKCGIDLEAL